MSLVDQKTKELNKLRYTGLAGLLFMYGGAGSIFAIGTYNSYVASKYHAEDQSITTGKVSIVQSLVLLFCQFGVFIAPYLRHLLWDSTIITLGVFCGIFTFGTFMLAYVDNFLLYIAISSISYGTPKGVIYFLSLESGWKLFPNIKSRITGILLFSYASAPLYFNYVIRNVVNPDNEPASIITFEGNTQINYFEQVVYQNVPQMFKALAFMFTIIFVNGYFLVNQVDKAGLLDIMQKPNDDNENPREAIEVSEEEKQIMIKKDMVDPQQLKKKKEPLVLYSNMKTLDFWLIVGMNMTGLIATNQILFCYKDYGLVKYNDQDQAITFIGGLASILNGIFRATWGFICEKYGPKSCLFFLTLIETITISTLPYTPNIYVFGLSIIIMQICHGGLVICNASLILVQFGLKNGSKTYPLVELFQINVCIFIYIMNAYIQEAIGYEWTFAMMGCTSFIGFILCVLTKEKNLK